jgi:hypothetical protein
MTESDLAKIHSLEEAEKFVRSTFFPQWDAEGHWQFKRVPLKIIVERIIEDGGLPDGPFSQGWTDHERGEIW